MRSVDTVVCLTGLMRDLYERFFNYYIILTQLCGECSYFGQVQNLHILCDMDYLIEYTKTGHLKQK